MKLSFQHVSGEKKHDRAISVCAYMSDRFDANKHLRSFSEFVINGQEGYDILVFREPGMSVPVGPTTRVFDVTSPELGYARHMWRYLGGELGYDWTWFRGMDTPEVPAREDRLAAASLAVKNDVLIWHCPSRRPLTVMGRCAVTRVGGLDLVDYIREIEVDGNDWRCDEVALSNWISARHPKVSLALDGPLSNKPHQLGWVISRLCEGNHTTIIKDRDDR
jgi:hypothetical protein